MDHETAVRSNAAERYLLGGMGDPEKEQFEEHYFSCASCAEEVRTGQVFRANARAVFRDDVKPVKLVVPRPVWRWVASASVAVNLALLAVAGYQLRQAGRPYYLQEVVVIGPARSAVSAQEISAKTTHVALTAHLPEGVTALRYELKDEAGALRKSGYLAEPPRELSAQAILSLPVAGLTPGPYQLVVHATVGGTLQEIGRRTIRIRPAK